MTTTMKDAAAKVPTDPLVPLSRTLFYLGVFGISFLSLRVSEFTIGDILLVGSALTLVPAWIGGRTSTPKGRSPAWSAGAWLVIVGATLSGWNASDAASHMLVVVRLAFLIVVLLWMVPKLLDTPERLLRGTMWWLCGAALAGAGSIIQAVAGPVLPGLRTNGDGLMNGRYTGFTEHVTDLAAVTCGAFVVALALFVRRRTWMLALIVAGSVAGVVLSASVSGLLATAVGCLLVMARGRPNFTQILLVAIGGTVCLALLIQIQEGTLNALSLKQRIEQVTGQRSYIASESAAIQDTLSTRETVNELGLKRGVASPVGVGMDPTSGQIQLNVGIVLEPHNLLINGLYRGGWLVALGLVLLLGSVLRRGWSLPRGTLASAVYAGMVTEVVFAMTSPPLVARYLWLPVVLTVTFIERSERDTEYAHETSGAGNDSEVPRPPVHS